MDASGHPKRPRPPLAGCSDTQSLNEEEEEIQSCYYCQLSSPSEHVKSLIGSGDSDNSPPFSLEDLDKNKRLFKIRHCGKVIVRQALVLKELLPSLEPPGVDLEDQYPLLQEATFKSLSSHDKFNPLLETEQAKHFKTRISRATNMAQHGSYNNNSDSISGMETPSHSEAAENYSAHEEQPIGDVKDTLSQLSYQDLKEENCMLKKIIQTTSASLTQMVRNLERTPQATMSKEKDTQDLEALVQQMELNVHVMTEEALKAKRDIEKMKLEISFLQAELTCYKLENRSLRLGQSNNMGAVKWHVDVALQNLIKVSNYAQATIRQIVFGANTLMLFGNLQETRGRFTEIEKEDEIVKEPTT